MDGERFDELSRALTRGISRRGAIRSVAAAVLGGAALAGSDDASARPAICRPAGRYCTTNRQCCNGKCRTGKRVPITSRNICDCNAPLAMCGKMCRDLSSDPNHCGACGNQIDRNSELCCDGVPTPIDENNCHACGEVCGPDDICCGPEIGCAASCESDSGACVPPTSCTPTGGDFFCAVSYETCEVVSAECGTFIDSAGQIVNATPTYACQTDADCAPAVALNGNPSGVAICAYGIVPGNAYVPGLPGSGTCAIYVTNIDDC